MLDVCQFFKWQEKICVQVQWEKCHDLARNFKFAQHRKRVTLNTKGMGIGYYSWQDTLSSDPSLAHGMQKTHVLPCQNGVLHHSPDPRQKEICTGVNVKLLKVSLFFCYPEHPLQPQITHSTIFPSSSFSLGTRQMQLVPKFVSLVWIQRKQHKFS